MEWPNYSFKAAEKILTRASNTAHTDRRFYLAAFVVYSPHREQYKRDTDGSGEGNVNIGSVLWWDLLWRCVRVLHS
jgi:hypothetical protein